MKTNLAAIAIFLLLCSAALAVGSVTRIVDFAVQSQVATEDAGAPQIVALGGSTAGKWVCCDNPTTSPVVIGGYDISLDGGLRICKTNCNATGACYPAAPNVLYARVVAREDAGVKLLCQEGR